MPKELEQDGFRFYIYYNDHTPSHVHVKKAGMEVIINLGDESTKPYVRENRRMSFRDMIKALEIAARERKRLERSWRRIHG